MGIGIVVLLFFATAAARADFAKSAADCPEMRLDAPGKPLANYPVMDQNPMGLCWAFSTSVMVDSWRRSHPSTPAANPNFITSPYPIAAALTESDAGYDAETGLPTKATNAFDKGNQIDLGYAEVLRAGSCDQQKVFRPGIGDRGMDKKLTDAIDAAFTRMNQFYADKNGLRKIYAQGKALGKKGTALTNYVLYERGAAPIVQELECKLVQDKIAFPFSKIVESVLVRVVAEGGNRLDADRRFFEAICRENRLFPALGDHPPKLKQESIIVDRPKQYAKRIRQLLLHNQQPVGIEYCANVLTKPPGYQGVQWQGGLAGTAIGGNLNCKPEGSRDDNHASVVIGMHWDEQRNRCQLIVRNSWGGGCKSQNYSWPCEEGKGNIFVDEDALGANIYRLDHFEAD